jgi:hypothetical protein
LKLSNVEQRLSCFFFSNNQPVCNIKIVKIHAKQMGKSHFLGQEPSTEPGQEIVGKGRKEEGLGSNKQGEVVWLQQRPQQQNKSAKSVQAD